MDKIRALWAAHKGRILCLSALGLLFLFRFAFSLPCPVHYVTGISCPGCGMTRGLWHLALLDVSTALHYHPLSIALPPFVLLWILTRVKKWKRGEVILLSASVALLLGVYLYRMITGGGGVLVFAPREGLIGRAVTTLLRALGLG